MNYDFINKYIYIQINNNNIYKYYIKKLLGYGSVGHIYLIVNQQKKFVLKISNDNCYNELLTELIIMKHNLKQNTLYYPLHYGKIIIKDNNVRFGIIYPFVGLYNLDGTWAQTIGTMNETNGLPSAYTYQSPFLTFSTSEFAYLQ